MLPELAERYGVHPQTVTRWECLTAVRAIYLDLAQLDYVLHSGLDLGTPYQVAPNLWADQYPTGLNNTHSGTGLPWAPATDGPGGLTCRVNPNGSLALWASTSTVSDTGDQGADPNKLVEITDNLGATPANESEACR